MADRKALCLTSTGLAEIPSGDRLVLPGDPLFNLHAVTKQYADRLIPHIPDRGGSLFASGGVETSVRFNSSAYAGSSGRLWVSYFTATTTTTITKLVMLAGATVTVGATLARMALFTVAPDGSITKVAQTASDNTLGTSGYTAYERVLSTVGGFPASYTLVSGTRYALGWLQVATTPCELYGSYIGHPYAEPIPSREIAAQTDIGASYAVANLAPFTFVIYLAARP
jgi:hypothetical protein